MSTESRGTTRMLSILLALALPLGSCGRQAGPPPIAAGAECAACGMSIEDVRFAAELRSGGAWKTYDDIGCLLRAAREDRQAPVWLTDYDSRALHAADSMWVVKGSLPTPMGSGCVAFLDRAAADEVATEASGRVMRYAELLATDGRP